MNTAMDTCPRYLLARKPVGAVEVCHCGAVHLTIGGVTLRLVPEVMPELAELLAEAVEALPVLEALLARRLLPAEAQS